MHARARSRSRKTRPVGFAGTSGTSACGISTSRPPPRWTASGTVQLQPQEVVHLQRLGNLPRRAVAACMVEGARVPKAVWSCVHTTVVRRC